MPQPPLAGPAQPVGQEVSVVMTKDDVGNDLRFGWVLLHLAARPESVTGTHPRQQLSQIAVTKASPLGARKQGIAGNDQDLFARTHALSLLVLSMPRHHPANGGVLHPKAPAAVSAAPSAEGLLVEWLARR